MAEIIVPILVALITAGIPAVVAIRHLTKKNTEEHNKSYTILESLDKAVDRVETKVDHHLGWHKLEEEIWDSKKKSKPSIKTQARQGRVKKNGS